MRGVNVGGHNRLPMAALRTALEGEGFEDVRTYLQSGNVVLRSRSDLSATGTRIERVVESLGATSPVVMRTSGELASVLALHPLAELATDDARLLVVFLTEALPEDRMQALRELEIAPNVIEIHGRELYAWCPDGVSSPIIGRALAPARLGRDAVSTGRNWKTVRALVELADR